MLRLIQVLLLLIAAQQSSAIAVAAQVWSYQFTPTGSRPFRSGCEACTPDYLGMHADVTGTFSIVIDWETNTGMLGHVNDGLVNAATIVSSPPGTVLLPTNSPELSDGSLKRLLGSMNAIGTVTYSNGMGHLVSTWGQPNAPTYDIWFTPTAATFSVRPFVEDSVVWVEGAFAAFTGSSIAGDFNYDGRADGRDYVQWRNSGGSQVDYNIWRFGYGAGSSAAAGAPVPEASLAVLLVTALGAILSRRCGARKKRAS